MNLDNFKLLKEDGDSYHVGHPNGRKLTVPKKGLSEKAHKLIQKMKSSPQHLDEGGLSMGEDEGAEAAQDKLDTAQAAQDESRANLNSGYATPEEAIAAQNAANQTPAEPQGSSAPAEPAAIQTAPVAAPASQGSGMEAAFNEQKAANTAGATAVGAQGTAEADAITKMQAAMDDLPSQQDIITAHKAKDDQLMQAYQDRKIDPDHFWNSKSTAGKVTAGLGILLGGPGSWLNNGQNAGMQVIQSRINADIDAQKNDQSKTLNLWKMNRESLGTDLAANIQTQNQLLTGVKYKLLSAASQFKGPIAAANAQAANAQIDQQMAQNRFKMSLLSGPTQETSDPAQHIGALQRAGLAAPEQAKQALEEVKNRTNIANNGDKILEGFDEAAREQRTFGGGGISNVKNMIPGINSTGISTLHQLMLPNFKTIDGTVRQAAMDESFHNLTPQWGDSDQRIAEKRAGLVNWMESEKAAPVSKSIGVDLDKYNSTNWRPSQAAVQPEMHHEANGRISLWNPQTKQFLGWQK